MQSEYNLHWLICKEEQYAETESTQWTVGQNSRHDQLSRFLVTSFTSSTKGIALGMFLEESDVHFVNGLAMANAKQKYRAHPW